MSNSEDPRFWMEARLVLEARLQEEINKNMRLRRDLATAGSGGGLYFPEGW